MHDPLTKAFEIKYPWKKWGKKGQSDWEKNYRETFISVWHKDPETDGSDDSCGWFVRSRHCDESIIEEIKKHYDFDWDDDYGGLFDKDGNPRFSVSGVVLNLFSVAAFIHFKYNRGSADKFMRKHLAKILHFAENHIDSLHPTITQKYGKEPRGERIDSLARTVYPWIVRETRKWYQHPRWHIHHWQISFEPWGRFRRRFWDKCCICNKRGFKESAMGNWGGTKIWHRSCRNERDSVKNG